MTKEKEKFRTHLSEDELDHFEKVLKQNRKETKEEIETLKSSAEDVESNADDVQSGTDHHPGDVASDAQQKKTTFQLLEKQREKLKLIEAALERIESKTYGICTATGKPIQKERLEAIPHALHAIDAKKK